MFGILPNSSLVPVWSPLCLVQGALCKTADPLNLVLDGENTQIHTRFSSSLYPQQIQSSVLSLSFQINLHLGLLAVTEADTALSTSVGGQAKTKRRKMLLEQNLGF